MIKDSIKVNYEQINMELKSERSVRQSKMHFESGTNNNISQTNVESFIALQLEISAIKISCELTKNLQNMLIFRFLLLCENC